MLTILPLQFSVQFTTPAILPAFKGSTLRGAFGHALKKIACTLRHQECHKCLLTANCPYSLIFATEQLSDSHIAARPHPYLFTPPEEETRQWNRGDTMTFELTLLGPAVEFLPHIIYAVEEMGRSGLGKKNRDGAGNFTLTEVRSAETRLYNSREKILHRATPQTLALTPAPPTERLTVTLQTPLRVKADNTLQRSITFPLLVRACLRRISALEKSYSSQPPELDFTGLCRDAEKVECVNQETHWVEYARYSNRQKSNMLFGGVMGTLDFAGELAPFVPLLRYAEAVNLGKQTAFGLGHFGVACTV